MDLIKGNGRSHKYDRPLTQFVHTYTCVLICVLSTTISTLQTIEHDIFELETRGPKGPLVAHQRKRYKVTVEPFTEDH